MVPIAALRLAALELLGADSATLNPGVGDEVEIMLVQNDFAPAESIILADVTLANFDGSTAISAGAGAQPVLADPGTNDAIMDIKMPAGGYRWETTGMTHLPQTIYGYVLLDSAHTVVYAAQRFVSPITLTAINQRIDIGQPTIVLPANTMF